MCGGYDPCHYSHMGVNGCEARGERVSLSATFADREGCQGRIRRGEALSETLYCAAGHEGRQGRLLARS